MAGWIRGSVDTPGGDWSAVAALKPTENRRSEHPGAKIAGLLLRVSPGGAKSWVMRYVAPSDERRRMKLGTYPALGQPRRVEKR